MGKGKSRRRSSTPSPRRVIVLRRTRVSTRPSSTSPTRSRVVFVPRSMAATRISSTPKVAVRRIAVMRRAWVAVHRRDGIQQILVVLAAVWAYELARMLIHPNWPAAMANAQRVDNLERALNFAWEQSLQRAFLGVPEVIEAMNLFYFLGHFLLTAAFFVWLY